MTDRQAGYSLFEVLLAFAIMAMILSVLLPRQADVLTRIRHIDERLLAQDFALSRMDMLGVVEPLVAGQTKGQYRGWRWRQSIEPDQIAKTGLEAFRIEIVLEAQDGTVLATLTDLRHASAADTP